MRCPEVLVEQSLHSPRDCERMVRRRARDGPSRVRISRLKYVLDLFTVFPDEEKSRTMLPWCPIYSRTANSATVP